MSELLVAGISAVTAALLRELLIWYDRDQRRRGRKRTRARDRQEADDRSELGQP